VGGRKGLLEEEKTIGRTLDEKKNGKKFFCMKFAVPKSLEKTMQPDNHAEVRGKPRRLREIVNTQKSDTSHRTKGGVGERRRFFQPKNAKGKSSVQRKLKSPAITEERKPGVLRR